MDFSNIVILMKMMSIMNKSTEIDESIEIGDSEVIIRIVISPVNVSGNRIKMNIFQPPRGTQDISCLRTELLTESECLSKGKEIASKRANSELHGFALLTKHCILSSEATVEDSRDPPNFYGHADIKMGIFNHTSEKMPLGFEEQELLDSIKEKLMSHSLFIEFKTKTIKQKNGDVNLTDCEKNELLHNYAERLEKVF